MAGERLTHVSGRDIVPTKREVLRELKTAIADWRSC